jgi:hypothetical protein
MIFKGPQLSMVMGSCPCKPKSSHRAQNTPYFVYDDFTVMLFYSDKQKQRRKTEMPGRSMYIVDLSKSMQGHLQFLFICVF